MNTSKEDQSVDLNSFAEMAGFPVELVQKELFNSSDSKEEVSLSELREAMISYLNSTMLVEEETK